MWRKNIFLTGEIQVGKSTIISEFLKKCATDGQEITGFKTKPFIDNGVFKGYYIEDQMDIKRQISNDMIVGRNIIDGSGKTCIGVTEVFEKKGVEILQRALLQKDSIILMDELGFFEKDAMNFQKSVHKCLDSNEHMVLGVLKKRKVGFLDSIASRKDVVVIEVDIHNRNNLNLVSILSELNQKNIF